MSWHEEYRERYRKLKSEGKSFFPYAVFKDTLMIFFILTVLCLLSYHYGAPIEDPADPTDSTYNPRPEWYFLFLFQALKLFPGKLESIAAVAVPAAAVTFLFILPFIDRGPERHPFDRLFLTLLGLGALASMGFLTYRGATSPLTNPIVEKDPMVMTGQRLYAELNCAYCHKIGGKGGTVGPELDKVAGDETEEWLIKHFRDPQAVTPGSAMPKFNLLEEEIGALAAYIKSLGGAASYTLEATRLFKENCGVCHRIGKEGAEVGPDLSLIGRPRDKNYLKRYIQDPSKLNPSSSMPGFGGQLTDLQIEDLARYLSAQKGP